MICPVIIISVMPRHLCRILNGEKTLEIRKSAPQCKKLPATVYIYCTKGNYIGYLSNRYVGKVVAKFTLKEAEEIFAIKGPTPFCSCPDYRTTKFDQFQLYHKARLDAGEMDLYLHGRSGFAWHIDDLQIFEKPMELSDFKYEKRRVRLGKDYHWHTEKSGLVPVKRAPQSWMYAEEPLLP